MIWILSAAGLGVAGLVVLAVTGRRVAVAARTLDREIADARAQLEHRQTRLHGPGG